MTDLVIMSYTVKVVLRNGDFFYEIRTGDFLMENGCYTKQLCNSFKTPTQALKYGLKRLRKLTT